MTGSERRDQIINQIKKSSIPVSGAQLAKEFDVSRQVIVQDIALIRAAGHEIHKQGISSEYSTFREPDLQSESHG